MFEERNFFFLIKELIFEMMEDLRRQQNIIKLIKNGLPMLQEKMEALQVEKTSAMNVKRLMGETGLTFQTSNDNIQASIPGLTDQNKGWKMKTEGSAYRAKENHPEELGDILKVVDN